MSNMTKISKKKQHKIIVSSDIGCTWGIETTDEPKEVESREVRNAWRSESCTILSFPAHWIHFHGLSNFPKTFKHFNMSSQLMKVMLWNNEQVGKLSPLRFEPSWSFLSLKGFDHKLDGSYKKVAFQKSMVLKFTHLPSLHPKLSFMHPWTCIFNYLSLRLFNNNFMS